MDLSNKSVEDLRVIARDLGVDVHHKLGRDKVANAIAEKLLTQVERKPVENEVKQEPVDVWLNPDDVREALKPFTDKFEDFEVSFLKDNTWMFRRGKYTESGTMSMPLTLVKRKAELFCRPRGLQILGRDGGDQTYTGAVLRA